MERIVRLLGIFFLMATSAVAQAVTPEGALVELVLAPDIKTALKHYPAALSEAVAALPPRDLAYATQALLPSNVLRASDAKAHEAEDGQNLLVIERNDQPVINARVTRRITDGLTAVLQVSFCGVAEGCRSGVELWMRLEDGEWRLTEIADKNESSYKLDSPDLLARFRGGEQRGNEASAVGSLRTLVTALVSYESSYAGLPEQMAFLAGDMGPGQEPTPEHAMLLSSEFAGTPCIRNGYRFDFTVVRHGDEQHPGEYFITAIPVEFGKTGTRSFYADQSGVIRGTGEDRKATAQDPPLE